MRISVRTLLLCVAAVCLVGIVLLQVRETLTSEPTTMLLLGVWVAVVASVVRKQRRVKMRDE